jgi:hypothetical protein
VRRAVAGVGALAVALFAPTAAASIQILDSETVAPLEEFDNASCRVTKGNAHSRFVAFSLPANDLYVLDVFIAKSAWEGFGHTYDLVYGDTAVIAQVFGPGPGENYSNEYGIPGTPPGFVGAGAVKISKNGKRFSVGAFGLPDRTFTKGVTVTGAARCKYKKR